MTEPTRLLSREDVARLLGRSISWVDRARRATDPNATPPPMPGWINLGTERKPSYQLPSDAYEAYVDSLRTSRPA